MGTMPRNSIAIQIGDPGRDNTVSVNGHNIARATTAVTVHFDAQGNRKAVIELGLRDIAVDGQVEICVPDATRDALITLGWSPPEKTK